MRVKSHNDITTEEWETSDDPILPGDKFLRNGFTICDYTEADESHIWEYDNHYPITNCKKLIQIL